MKKNRICPKCGKQYSGYPALSRTDNKTKICPDCGTIEAIEDYNRNKKMLEESLCCKLSIDECPRFSHSYKRVDADEE